MLELEYYDKRDKVTVKLAEVGPRPGPEEEEEEFIVYSYSWIL